MLTLPAEHTLRMSLRQAVIAVVWHAACHDAVDSMLYQGHEPVGVPTQISTTVWRVLYVVPSFFLMHTLCGSFMMCRKRCVVLLHVSDGDPPVHLSSFTCVPQGQVCKARPFLLRCVALCTSCQPRAYADRTCSAPRGVVTICAGATWLGSEPQTSATFVY